MENSIDLGELVSRHEENKAATGTNLILGLVCLGLTAMMTVFFLGEKEISFNKILFGAGAIFSFLGGISCVFAAAKNRGSHVELYENGLKVEKGGKKHAARWDEIAFLYESVEKMHMNGQYVYDRCNYTVVKTDGEEFVLSNMISNIDRIGRELKEKTFERLYPLMTTLIRGGGEVKFDALAVDERGIGGIPWTELRSVKLKDGVLEITDKDGKAVVKGNYAATPNAHLLMALLREKLPLES